MINYFGNVWTREKICVWSTDAHATHAVITCRFFAPKQSRIKAFGYFSTNIGFPKTKMPNTSTTNTAKFRTMVVWVLQALITDCTKDHSCSFIIFFFDNISYRKKFRPWNHKKGSSNLLESLRINYEIIILRYEKMF